MWNIASLALGEALVKTGFVPELKLLKDNIGTARSDMQKRPFVLGGK
jgi:hypothetical protein